VRILERKGFVAHKSFGKSHQYYPAVEKKAYTRSYLKNFVGSYFGNSFQELVSFFAKSDNMSVSDLEYLMNEVKKDLENEK
jgi:BlaI family transcriptional regulator, penicillinase repressor